MDEAITDADPDNTSLTYLFLYNPVKHTPS